MSDPLLVTSGPEFEAAGLAHMVRRPVGNGPHRTAILIHGRSGDEKVMWIFARTLPTEQDWLIVSPRAPLADPDGGYSWHPPQSEGFPSFAGFTEAADAIARLARSLPDLYDADPDHLYLMGFSQGAASAIATAIQHPGLTGGIVALMGFAPPGADETKAKSALTTLPIFMAAGQRDDTIPIHLSRESAQWLEGAGANLDYHEYETSHKMNTQALSDLKAWWKAQAE